MVKKLVHLDPQDQWAMQEVLVRKDLLGMTFSLLVRLDHQVRLDLVVDLLDLLDLWDHRVPTVARLDQQAQPDQQGKLDNQDQANNGMVKFLAQLAPLHGRYHQMCAGSNSHLLAVALVADRAFMCHLEHRHQVEEKAEVLRAGALEAVAADQELRHER